VQYLLSKIGDSLQFRFYNKEKTATADYYCSHPALHNFLFVNVPKCASQTVHAWSMQMATRDGAIKEPYRFTILREPYGRLKSTFAYAIGAKYQYKFTVEDIGDWFFGKNLPEELTPNHADLFVHFVPQTVFIDNAPIAIDHWYSTGDMRQLRRTLSHISRCNVGWQEENRSRYTQEFIISYNNWFTKNQDAIDDYLAEDRKLYTTHCSS